jgi:hypothetical protein
MRAVEESGTIDKDGVIKELRPSTMSREKAELATKNKRTKPRVSEVSQRADAPKAHPLKTTHPRGTAIFFFGDMYS